LGIFPGFGGTQRYPKIAKKGNGIKSILTGDTFTAQRAYQ
jgi:enoyl-CoA hydratase/carnithine racemase